MYHKFFNLIIILPLILSLPIDERLYKELKENAQYEIIDYNVLFPNKSNSDTTPLGRSSLCQLSLGLSSIAKIASLFKKAETIASLVVNVITLGKLLFQKADYTCPIPKNYNYVDEYDKFSVQFEQREFEPGSAYAATLATSYRRAKKVIDEKPLSPTTILERFKKINVVDAYSFIHSYGLLEYKCRNQSFCGDCEYDDCVSSDGNTTKATTYKSNEIYAITGQEEIKKEILKNGPVVTSFIYVSDLLYYKKGYYEFVSGKYLGYHAAVIVGWDENGWIAHNSFGSDWGDNGFFKVKYENNIRFGEVVYASVGFVCFKKVLFAFLIAIIF